MPLKDERYTIFLNTKSKQSNSNKDLDAFFKYLNGGISTIGTGKDSDSALVRILDEYVVGINGSEDWRQGFMKYELNLIESREKGKALGEAKERSRIVKGLKTLGLSDADIAKGVSIPVERVQNILRNSRF